MNKAYLLIGGNIGDRQKMLSDARELISEYCGEITRTSSIYETAAWGKTDQKAFLNQALEVRTILTARQLMRKALKVEKLLGRERKEKYGPRTIDIDILLFNNELHNYPLLKLPHPEMQNRRFALLPLTEIAPDLIHPVFNKTIHQILQEVKDDLLVMKTSLK
jgi:2-amino-4-hydroxy-6-hydroxymethyldihydropteridine diphosphokinase